MIAAKINYISLSAPSPCVNCQCFDIFRYGFVTFSVPEEAENVLKQQQLYYQGQKLNLGPAVRKQVTC